MRKWINYPRVAATLAVASLAALGLAGPVLGDPAGDAIVEAEAVNSTSGSFPSLYSTCPSGQRVVGGGTGMDASPVNNGQGSYILRNAPQRTSGNGRLKDGQVAERWAGTFEQDTGSNQNTRAFALCSQANDAKVQVTVKEHKDGLHGTKVMCPRGRRAIGGGWDLGGGTLNVREAVSGPVDKTGKTKRTKTGDVARGWRVALWGSPVKAWIYAICSKDSKATLAAADLTMPASSAMELAVQCPNVGDRVTGGGAGLVGVLPSAGSDAFPPPITTMRSNPLDETLTTAGTLDGDIARAWIASMLNYGAERTYRVFAVCEPAIP